MYYRLTSIGNSYRRTIIASVIAIVLVSGATYFYISTAPANFPTNKIIVIPKGASLSAAAVILKENHVIRSELLFKLAAVFVSGHRQIRAGKYLFEDPTPNGSVAYRLVNGIQGLPQIKITFVEGLTTSDMGAILGRNIPGFDVATFVALAKPLEGTLFPDTYFFDQASTPADVVAKLTGTFTDKTKPLLLDIQAFGHSAKDILIMASLVEREATSSVDRRLIAGILWRRLAIGMPLQVDTTFYYLWGKESSELTMKDLAADSPFNLYKHTGLPPTPIDNPSLSAIVDTINPTPSKYLFFLSDKHGVMHYAPTLEGHNANKAKYL